jgi:hypothetical protein
MMWKRRWKNENLHRRSKVRCWIMQKQKNTFFSVFCLLGSISHDCMFTCKNPIKRYSSLYAKKKLYISVLVSARLNSHSKIKTVKVKKIYEYSLLLISMCAPIWSSEMQQQKHKNLYESRAFFFILLLTFHPTTTTTTTIFLMMRTFCSSSPHSISSLVAFCYMWYTRCRDLHDRIYENQENITQQVKSCCTYNGTSLKKNSCTISV